MYFYRTIIVPIAYQWYYFWDNKFVEKLDAGYYTKSGFWMDKWRLIVLPVYLESFQIVNQQLVTQDMITLRLSAVASYRVIDGEKFIANFLPEQEHMVATMKGVNFLRELIQIYLRDYISKIESKILAESQEMLRDIDITKVNEELEKLGLKIEQLAVRDIGFPKKIQDLYAKKLEAQINAQTELENARTVVATTRALKNASKLLEGDKDIKFLQYLETITKIASTGKHNFHFWEFLEK